MLECTVSEDTWEGGKIWEILFLCLYDNGLFGAVCFQAMIRGEFLLLWGRKWLLWEGIVGAVGEIIVFVEWR